MFSAMFSAMRQASLESRANNNVKVRTQNNALPTKGTLVFIAVYTAVQISAG